MNGYRCVCDASLCGFCGFFFQAEDGIRDYKVTGVQTCALPILHGTSFAPSHLGTFAASRYGWLAQLVRAPVSHTGGHRFESCTAHYTSSPLPPPDRKSVV